MKNNTGMNPAALMALLNGDLSNALIASTPGGIEAQEADGQRYLVSNDILPCDFRDELGHTVSESIFQEMGIKFGKKVNDIFIECQLPNGWKKTATGHDMWSELKNEKDEVVAEIFYKAAFYDRSAFIRLVNKK